MKRMIKTAARVAKVRIILLFAALWVPLACLADNEKDNYIFRKIDHQQGLSNSAVLSLFQDNEGLMWFGTYDGVNCWDGKTMEVFRSDFSERRTLNNNVIHSISQADSSCLWIATHCGANRFSKDSRRVVNNFEFPSDFVIHSNSQGNSWALGYGWIAYYNTFHRRFVNIPMPPVRMLKVDVRAFVTDEGDLWLFPYESGDLVRFSLDSFDCDTLSNRLHTNTTHFHSKPIKYVCYQNGVFCFYDSDDDLFVYDIARKSKIFIRNIGTLVRRYGLVTGIASFNEDVVIAFQTNGLMRLRMSRRYEEEVIDRNLRIFCLYNDPRQGVLWLGTDGQGTLMYSREYHIGTNLMLNELSPNLTRQVRAVLTDKYGGLWFGTKGDGLWHVRDYADGPSPARAEVYTLDGQQPAASYAKPDTEFRVYTLQESRYRNGFWIGAGSPGLCYYSFDGKSVRPLSGADGGTSVPEVEEVHSIFEENDSVLYLATAGKGFCKAVIGQDARGTLRIKSLKHYRFFHEQSELLLYYSMVPQGDSLLWLGSLQKGLVRFNRKTEEYQVFSLSERMRKSVDDVLSLHWRKDELWVGTTSGLVCVSFDGNKMIPTYIGREQGLLNDMIHSILEDASGLLWLGTNRGLIKFNPDNLFSHAYYYNGGLQVGEFSDDAYYRCPYTGNLFFGGVNGLIYLNKHVPSAPEYYPEILLRKLTIEKTLVNLQDHYLPNRKGLRMTGSKVSFALSFVVPDYAGGGDVEYSYMLEGYDSDWGSFSSANEASYFNVPPGDYLFKVRYKKDVFATDYKTFVIPLHILPPWYQTSCAYLIYVLLGCACAVCIFYLFHKYACQEETMRIMVEKEAKQRAVFLEEKNRQEHDLLNNCTLIYQACDQLGEKNLSPAAHSERLGQIRDSVMSLMFSYGVSDECFRLLSSLQFSVTSTLPVDKLVEELMEEVWKEGYDLSSLNLEIMGVSPFPVYKNAVRCILYFCFLYLSARKPERRIKLEVFTDDKGLMTVFSDTEKDVLEGMVAVLSGQEPTDIKSPDTDILFRIRAMQRFVLSALKQHGANVSLDRDEYEGEYLLPISYAPAAVVEREQSRKSALLLEDRDEMVWLISDLLSDEYDVRAVDSVQTAFEEMHLSAPALFLVDMQMYAGAESTFMNQVEKNRSLLSKTVFIPMLTWKVSTAMQRQLILGADAYLYLPYDISFLRETVHKAIHGKRETEQVHMEELEGLTSSIVCSNAEQADFVRKFLQVMERNMDKEELGTTFIAEQLSMSPRQFVRRLKEVSGMTPSDFIKDYRMEKAARLLRDDSLSIQEVIARVGISSRAYFYKEFTRKYGVTPKNYREQA